MSQKILIFTHYAELYGASRSLLDLLSEISKKPCLELIVFVPYDGPLIQELKSLNIAYKIISYSHNVFFNQHNNEETIPFFNKLNRNYRRIKNYIKIIRRLNKKVKLINPDIIYTNSSVIYWGAFLCILNRKKHVWHIREMKNQFNIRHHFGLLFFRFLLKKSTVIICNSKATAKDYSIDHLKKTIVIYNGLYTLDEAKFLFANRKKTNYPLYSFGVVGGVDVTKGQLSAIEALSKWKRQDNNDFLLYIIGAVTDKNYYNKLKAFAAQNDVTENIVFTGDVKNVEAYYAKMDVLICPSFFEAFGRVIVEAMVRGIFVIARNVGGIPEIIDDKITGFLYNNNDELINCINYIKENKPELESIKCNAIHKVEQNFLKEAYCKKMMQAFNFK